jgi:hypothetical protein
MVEQAAHFVALGSANSASTDELSCRQDNAIIGIEQAIYK